MKKPDKRDKINLFFSAFLILAFIVCAHFFSEFTATLSATIGLLISVIVFIVFGLLIFYATRVGDGKAVKRFSLVTLIVLVLPTVYIIVAALAPGLPLHDIFVTDDDSTSVIVTLASIALGYGIPYTFLSGYELAPEENVEAELSDEPLEGGIEADLEDTDEAEADETEADATEVDKAENAQDETAENITSDDE